MALELKYKPDDYRPVYNELEFVIFENDIATRQQPNFKYLFKIYINFNTVATLEVFVNDINTGFGRADMHSIAEQYLTSDVSVLNSTNTGDAFFQSDNSIKTMTMEFGYQYDVAGVSTDFMPVAFTYNGGASQNFLNIKVFNSSLPYEREGSLTFFESVATDYMSINYVNPTTERKFLTQMPRFVIPNYNYNKNLQNVTMSDQGYIHCLNPGSTSNEVGYYAVDVYKNDGTVLNTATFQNPGTLVGSGEDMLRFPYAPASINNIDQSKLSAGVYPVISTDAKIYGIKLYNGGGVTISEQLWFNIVDDCEKYGKHVRLEFLNSLGGFDYFNFTKSNKRSETFERKDFKYIPNNINSSGVINYSSAQGNKKNYHTKSKPMMSLTSDWVTEETFDWLIELIASPEIYVLRNKDVPATTGNEFIITELLMDNIITEASSGDQLITEASGGSGIPQGVTSRVAVMGVKGDWQQKTEASDKLFNITIDIEFAFDNYTQRW